MDNMCSDSQSVNKEESSQCYDIKKDENSVSKSIFKFTSPVLRPVSQPINRCNKRYDSASEDDFVSCKINQTQCRRSKTKSFNEEKSESEYDNIFPLNLGSSPLSFSSVERGRPVEIQTIGSLLKGDYFELHLKKNWPPQIVSSEKKSKNPFDALGMDEKDISWASSMASPPPSIIPSNELNTKEKETLLPEEGFRNAQPRALFSPNSTDDDCGCKPLKISSDSELSEGCSYETKMRLSDVCQTLKDMNVKSLESVKKSFLNETDATLVSDLQRSQSPVIITKKKKKNIRKRGVVVMSPGAVKKCEDNLISSNSKSNEQSNQLTDDSFQNISFSHIDEICKNSLINDSGQDNQTLVPVSLGQKICYELKSEKNEILETVSDLECFLKAANLLEQGDVGTSSKNLKSLGNVKKGLVPFKNLINNESTVTNKRLRSELVSDEIEKSCEKKKLKSDDFSKNESEWDSITRDFLGSDNDITDSQISKTVEDIERVMENEEKKNLSMINEEPVNESLDEKNSALIKEELVETGPVKFPGFSTVSGKRITTSADALKKMENMFAENEKKLSEVKNIGSSNAGFSTASGSRIKIPKNPLKIAKNIFEDEDFNFCLQVKNNDGFAGFKTAGGKQLNVMFEPLSKATNITNNKDIHDESCRKVNENTSPSNKSSMSSQEDVEKQKEMSREIVPKLRLAEQTEKSNVSNFTNSLVSNVSSLVGFKTCSGKAITVSKKSLSNVEKLLDPEVLSESDEIIPPWLHAYSTSPSYLLEKKENPAFISQEDGNTTKAEPFVIKSPVLGSSDRFFRKGKKMPRKLDFETSSTPTFMAIGHKRDSSDLSVDFSIPFKKQKLESEEDQKVTSPSVIEARKLARLKQRELATRRNVKPVKGTLLVKKCSERQIRLSEFVENEFPGNYTNEELIKLGIKDYVVDLNIENAEQFRFKAIDYFGTSCCENADGIPIADDCCLILDDNNEAGVEEFTDAFFASPGVESSLISKEWVANHYKWIVWKLAHYETSFPEKFGGHCLTPENVMLQLKYRYDREVDRNERSALKKILERDDSSAKRIVLCVFKIKKVSAANNHEESENLTSYQLSVTDGWYSCNIRSDSAMTPLIEKGKITVGTKLVTNGAELVNGGQGISPLEITDNVYLKISTNSTRRIRWDSKLGFQKNPGPIPVTLNSILPQGGLISRVDVIIVRTYPIVFVEKKADGRRVTRNRRLEDKVAAAFQHEQEARIEKIYNDVQAEFQKKSTQKFDEEDLCELLQTCSDPSSLHLSTEQKNSLMKYKDLQSKEISEILQEKLKAEKINKRDVSELLKVKIVDLRKPDFGKPGILSLWRPSEDIVSFFVEGKAISLLNVAASNYNWSSRNIQLNTTRQTKYLEISRQVKYPSRSLTRICEISTEGDFFFDEIDCVGLVVFVHEMSFGSVSSQTVYVTDSGIDFVGITFWGSSADFGWENVLKVKSIVACSNLLLKKSSKSKNIPCVYVNENTIFTENPRQQHLIQGIENVKKILNQNIDDLIMKCQEEITSKLDNSHHQISKNLSNVSDSSCNDGSINKPKYFNGLAGKPNASSTPLKSKRIGADVADCEPSPIQKKIEKLLSYGEPPPISPLIPASNIKILSKKFKVPFKQNTNDITPTE